MNRGKYILIEGGDGSGKTTQVKLLGKYLEEKGIPFIQTKEPGGTEVARIYENILKNKERKVRDKLTPQSELFTFLSARSQVTLHVVKPALERGEWVISDRGFPSTIAYQGNGLGIPSGIIYILNQYSITHKGEVIQPDLIYIINVPAEIGLAKVDGTDEIELRGIDFHKKVNEGYLKFLEMYPDISIEIPYIENNPQEMHSLIIKNLEERFGI